MGSTSTERSRRLRRHRAGDHSLCLPERCDAATPAVAENVAPVAPAVAPSAPQPPPGAPELGCRGQWLWQQISDEAGTLTPGEQLLMEEACRSADRLDQLDRILRGTADDWLRFHSMNEDGSIVKVVVNGALMEVRQQQTTLALLLERLRQSRSGGAAKPLMPLRPPAVTPPPNTAAGGNGVAGVASLADRIAAKRGGQAAG